MNTTSIQLSIKIKENGNDVVIRYLHPEKSLDEFFGDWLSIEEITTLGDLLSCRRAIGRDSEPFLFASYMIDVPYSGRKKPEKEPVYKKELVYKKEIIPEAMRWEVWERDNFTCKHCGTRRRLTVDHIWPEIKGGEMVLSNLQTLCKSCNSSKGAR